VYLLLQFPDMILDAAYTGGLSLRTTLLGTWVKHLQ
jgi:hypothetical protein